MNKNIKFGVGISIIVLSIIYLGFTGFNQDFSYYMTVEELLAKETDLVDKKLKVAGQVVIGSIVRDQTPMLFEIYRNDAMMKISYTSDSPIPDTFKDRAEVVLDGKYGTDGVFYATKIQAKCASKYEAKLEEAPKY